MVDHVRHPGRMYLKLLVGSFRDCYGDKTFQVSQGWLGKDMLETQVLLILPPTST